MKIVHSSPVLSAKTSKGNDKFWQHHVCQNVNSWFTQSSHWQVNKEGVKSVVQFSDPYEVVPKNVGRANETTAKEQAYLEFESAVKKQIDKGYMLPGVTAPSQILPMLAHKYAERGDKMTWPVYVQPKYNGNRMLFDGTIGYTRGGKQNIPEVIAHLQCDTTGLLLDGELMLPGNPLLQESMKVIKKYRKGESEKLIYIVYDIVDPARTFVERCEELVTLINSGKLPANILRAPTHLATTPGDVSSFHKKFVEAKFEGTMVRDNSAGYAVGQRSNQLQKFKDFQDAEFTILDVVDGGGKYKGAAIFVCDNGHGTNFNCNPEGTMEYKRDLYNRRDELIGQSLTVRFQELSADLVPLFPVGVDIRERGEF